MLGRLRALATARIAAWSRRRHGRDEGVVTITRRRVYIVPTRLGVAYAVMLFAMLLAGLNYGNNLALALTFVLAAVGWVTMHQCHHNLAGVSIAPAGTRPPFAGDDAVYMFTLSATTPREDLVLGTGGRLGRAVSLGQACATNAVVELPTTRRGRVVLSRLRIQSTFPLGLFVAWTWTHPDLSCIVYPRPAPRDARAEPPPTTEPGAEHEGRAAGAEDYAGLRDFRSGDPPRRIAWKAWARGGPLVVKEYTGAAQAPTHLDLADVSGRDLEARLARLARWIVDAEARGDRYGLRLPDTEIPPGAGQGHRNRCLGALAVVGLAASAP